MGQGWIGKGEGPDLIRHIETIVDLVNQRAVFFFAFTQRLFRLLTLADVVNHGIEQGLAKNYKGTAIGFHIAGGSIC